MDRQRKLEVGSRRSRTIRHSTRFGGWFEGHAEGRNSRRKPEVESGGKTAGRSSRCKLVADPRVEPKGVADGASRRLGQEARLENLMSEEGWRADHWHRR